MHDFSVTSSTLFISATFPFIILPNKYLIVPYGV